MNGTIQLERRFFQEKAFIFFKNDEFTVTLFSYSSGIEAVEIKNSRGRMVVLPYFGQMIWDLEFDGIDLKMKNMFSEPKKSQDIIGTYGCFAFHSGLVRNGCPAPEDDHPLHGEMPCAAMDHAWLELTENSVKVCGSYEYVMGFGHHYCASPSVELHASKTYVTINMNVENLSRSRMPLQYMCHTNFAYLEQASFKQSIPSSLFSLRESIPAHVKTTENWLEYNAAIRSGEQVLETLSTPELYDPEIVFFADRLDEYEKDAEFQMISPEGTTFFTKFSTKELNYATRWILNNPDQKVAAFVLPATCRPEGYLAAEKAGTLISLAGGEKKSFTVITGKK
ncbi:aldose 1-epimerase family protein [Fictibacillus iocasae]|uniref:Aldose 1-epimerase family protein n=1 Tax=Fictibacillus iocasae TaxID=2715437 RepID=A0ABW2NMG1_9BACL